MSWWMGRCKEESGKAREERSGSGRDKNWGGELLLTGFGGPDGPMSP